MTRGKGNERVRKRIEYGKEEERRGEVEGVGKRWERGKMG